MTASSLLAHAISQARAAATTAEGVDLDDRLAVIGSHAALTVALRRVLWTLNTDEGDERDVAAEVDAEDGVQRPVIAHYNREQVAA
ncbi:hypothetical protein [Streptomyces niveus]|uniref:hypothetical protein n=1 Tax=Streptomyces niveus TaxID=193462 RepID=UPI003433F071